MSWNASEAAKLSLYGGWDARLSWLPVSPSGAWPKWSCLPRGCATLLTAVLRIRNGGIL
jgi:hypothetical protein